METITDDHPLLGDLRGPLLQQLGPLFLHQLAAVVFSRW
jgi:hypothetical protein